MSDNLNNFVALNSSYSTPSVLRAYNYVMRVLNKMSMMTTAVTVRVVRIQSGGIRILGRGPHFSEQGPA